MRISREAGVLWRQDRQLGFRRFLYAGWRWLRAGRRGPAWLRLNHFGRKIIERFENGFSFHRWRSSGYGSHSRMVSGGWRGGVALAILRGCLKVSAPEQFFGNRHDVVRFEAELVLKFLERR